MSLESRPSALVLGLALFSMFFGSGNLIYPLSLGVEASSNQAPAFFGFALTAVLLPLLGVAAMVLYDGKSSRFFDLLGSPLGFLFASLLLLIWIPLGSGPRCIALSYASLETNLDIGPAWLYGLVYSGLIALLVSGRRRALHLLGSFLTPLLLLCLATIFLSALYAPVEIPLEVEESHGWPLFFNAMVEGYNTQDLIAAFFFSASVMTILRRCEEGASLQDDLLLLLRAGVIAALILAVVYGALLYSASVHSAQLLALPREKMLAQLAKISLGPQMGLSAAIAVFLACLTTSVALVVVFTDYLMESFSLGRKSALIITLVSCYLMALTGLSGITAITSPLLQFCYPALLLLIVYGCMRKALAK